MRDFEKPEVQQEVQLLLAKLKLGDRAAIDITIDFHMDYASRLVRRSQYKFPHLKDDIYSASLFGLTQAVHWVFEGRLKHNNITGYIAQTIKRFVHDLVELSNCVYVPGATYRKGIALAYPSTISYTGNTEESTAVMQLPAPKKAIQFETDDIINGIRLTSFQESILRLRLEHFTDAEISEKLHVSREYITMVRGRMQDQFHFLKKE